MDESEIEGKPQRRNGALVGYDFDFHERSRRSFRDGLIAEIGFPALDAASKNSAISVPNCRRAAWRSKPGGSAPASPSSVATGIVGVSRKAKCQAFGTR